MRFLSYKSILLVFMLCLRVPVALADDAPARFYNSKEEGWFWYKDPKDQKQDEQAPEPPPVAQSSPNKKEKDQPFSVKWLRENMPVLLERAIDNPSQDNVSAYLYAQRVAMDKSQRYAQMSRQVVYSDPVLDENNRVPLASFAKPLFLNSVSAGGDEAMKHLIETSGIWMFYDSKCDFCKTQAYSIEELRKKYKFIVKYISLDGKPLVLPDGTKLPWIKDSGQARVLQLRVSPTTVMVTPPNNYMIVSQGLMSQDGLTERMLVAADTNNLLPPEISKKLNLYSRGVLTNTDMQHGASNDPSTWMKYLKDKLSGRYK